MQKVTIDPGSGRWQGGKEQESGNKDGKKATGKREEGGSSVDTGGGGKEAAKERNQDGGMKIYGKSRRNSKSSLSVKQLQKRCS